MALPILDGNQSATTLSTILAGGEHTPAHTVVSLGSQAITDMRSAVSGSVVSISNFPASQQISGTVTANAFVQSGFGLGEDIAAGMTEAGGIPISGTVTANTDSTSLFTALENYSQNWNDAFPVALKDSAYTTENPFPISGTVTANLSSSNLNSVTIGVRGTVTVGNNISIANFPATQNVYVTQGQDLGEGIWQGFQAQGSILIGGAVTATINPVTAGPIVQMDSGLQADPKYIMAVGGLDSSYNEYRVLKLDDTGRTVVTGTITVGNVVTIGSLPAISGTVTVGAMPNGALTTRFGSVTTASVAQLTSAVTNTSRKYLLVQNIATSTVTIGIGFAPTTTQGIQLTAGAGLTFDAFTPTGAIYWLSSVTGSNFSILEG